MTTRTIAEQGPKMSREKSMRKRNPNKEYIVCLRLDVNNNKIKLIYIENSPLKRSKNYKKENR